MSCREFEPSIERMLADEIGREERDRLLAHTEGCAGCREFVDLHYRLTDPEEITDLPDEAAFAAMRRAVLDRLRDERRVAGTGLLAALGDLFRGLAVRPAWSAAGLAAVVLAALASGWALGHGSGPDGMLLPPVNPVAGDDFVRVIGNVARRTDGLIEVADSPYVYSNVRLQDGADGLVALSFDVTRHVEVERDRTDPLVKEVVAQSLLNQESLATRLQAVSFAAQISDPVLEQALIHAMLDDPDLAVRMKAQSMLAGYRANEDIESAFLMVLSGEESVRMRLAALDYLAASQSVSRERIDDAIRNLPVEENRALMVRYVDELN